MELIEQRFVRISVILLMMIIFGSCGEVGQGGDLECLLESINVEVDGTEIEVGQHNGWTDTTSLILITFHRKSLKIPMGSNLKGTYKGMDIYFYQSKLDTLDKQEYSRIPNSIVWNKFTPKKMEEDSISPPYDPKNIQVEYNFKRNCFGEVIKGKGYIDLEDISNCRCK